MEGISAPPPYRIGERKEWITSDEPASAGFAILVRTSITNAERTALRERDDYITGAYTDEWNAKPPDERDVAMSPRVLQRQQLAPYIYDWNAEGRTADGGWAKIPPPAEAGPEAFDCILPEDMAFIIDVILGGYYHLGKAVSWRKTLAAIGPTSEAKPPDADPPPVEPTPIKSRKPRRSSSMPSTSASTG
jgi:hypothetical protein